MQVSGAVDMQIVIVRNICMSHEFVFFCVHSCTNSLVAQAMMLANTMWSCIKAEPTLIWELSCYAKKEDNRVLHMFIHL